MAENDMEAVLREAAKGHTMDYSVWPRVLPSVLARIDKNARTEFPIPNIPSRRPPARPPSPRFLAPLASDPVEAPNSPQGQNNQEPGSSPRASTAPASTGGGSSSAPTLPSLPEPIADMLEEVLSVLRTNFTQYPPHTIQRLAELVLEPRRHYRNVVPYLHALDRVVHVTSGANIYPLPPALPEIGSMSLSSATGAGNTIGSDEALGGALLTPIPWLTKRANGGGSDADSDPGGSSPMSPSGETSQQFQFQQQAQATHLDGRVRTESTETIEGPNGMGSIETVSVSVNGIPSIGAGAAMLSQRAGIAPANHLNREQQQQQHASRTTNPTTDEDTAMGEGQDEEEEVPHVRGPKEIGPADTGRVANYMTSPPLDARSIDVEAAVGRRAQQDEKKDADNRSTPEAVVPQSPKREATDELAEEPDRKRIRDDDGSSFPTGTPPGRQQQQQQQEGHQQPPLDQNQATPDEMDATPTTTTTTNSTTTEKAPSHSPNTIPDAQAGPDGDPPPPSQAEQQPGKAASKPNQEAAGTDGGHTMPATTVTVAVHGASSDFPDAAGTGGGGAAASEPESAAETQSSA
ncbi:hypothetical protein VTK26DRAFT_5105 [Humicola hyalothermophila]